MGNTCSCTHGGGGGVVDAPSPEVRPRNSNYSPADPTFMYDSHRRSANKGQYQLLFKKGKPPVAVPDDPDLPTVTRLVRRKEAHHETHIYAVRYPSEEQRPRERRPKMVQDVAPMDPYVPSNMAIPPLVPVDDWVCVSEEYAIFVCDTGLSSAECDRLVQTTEQVCKGNYAAYTYAKQTLGCREFPTLAQECWEPVHRVTHAIWNFSKSTQLQLDDREPHIVKYDITKKERQKLDMHTDKSEWTFLIALSDGCGLDFDGGGTFFEALDATVHVQRGHALVFPGKLRHCGQRINKGLRFLLVGFLVDKENAAAAATAAAGAIIPAGGTTDVGGTAVVQKQQQQTTIAPLQQEPAMPQQQQIMDGPMGS